MCDTARILAEYKDKPGFHIAEVADKMGIAYDSLKRILNEHDIYDLGVRKLIPFITITQDFTLLDHIEARLGRVALKTTYEQDFKLDLNGACRFMRESGEAMEALSTALSDGRVTKPEARECRKEIMELIQVCMSLLKRLDTVETK